MQGVEILNEVAKSEMVTQDFFIFCLLLLCGIVFIVVPFLHSCQGWSAVSNVYILIGIVLLISSAVHYKVAEKIEVTEYDILISDDVRMTEFLEVYEIIDEDGKIFTVREVE